MRFKRLDEETVVLSGLNDLLCELLRQIADTADPGDDLAVEERLYPSPGDSEESELQADWQEHVQPELRQLFQSSLDVVREDLNGLPAESSGAAEHTLTLRMERLDAWLNALNQARLALAARHHITERDLEAVPDHGGTRAFAIFQIHFYGILQEWMVRELTEGTE